MEIPNDVTRRRLLGSAASGRSRLRQALNMHSGSGCRRTRSPGLLDYLSQGLDSFTSKPSFSMAAVTAVRGSVPSSARAEIAAIAMLLRSTSKNFRNATRVSLRPKPSVRKNHAAALLSDGRVILAGGSNGSSALASIDVFDPLTGTIAPFATMSSARQGLSATTLMSGKVLLAGGGSAGTEILNPAGGATAAGPSMSAARTGHSALLLPNNNTVLMVGGTTASSAAEIFVEWQNAFRPFGSLSSARTAVAAGASGPSGAARVAGGADSAGAVSAAMDAVRFPMVRTDKLDYHPGELVTITGSGFAPGEQVTLALEESPFFDTHGPYAATADSNGNLTNTSLTVDAYDANIRFFLTAAGSTSGLTAGTTFTDNANKLQFTTSAFSVAAGTCSGTITIGTFQGSTPGNPTSTETITLSSTTCGGTGVATSGIPTVTISTSANSVSFSYKDTTAGTPTITATPNPALTTPTQQETITSLTPKLVFTSTAFSVNSAQCSSAITVQSQNGDGTAKTIAGSALTVNLSTNATPGIAGFFSDATCATSATTTSIAVGQSTSPNFYYMDSNGSTTPTLTAAATGYTSGTQTETVTNTAKVGTVTVSAQSGVLTYGTGGSATYTVTVNRNGNGNFNANLCVTTWSPSRQAQASLSVPIPSRCLMQIAPEPFS